jgi:hypothetical protein
MYSCAAGYFRVDLLSRFREIALDLVKFAIFNMCRMLLTKDLT